MSVARWQGNSEFELRFRAADRVLQAISSVETLAIDICVGDPYFTLMEADQVFMKAMATLVRQAKGKAHSLSISIDALSLDEYDEVKAKTATIVKLLPTEVPISIFLSGVDITNELLVLGGDEDPAFISRKLHTLTLNACVGQTFHVPPTTLREITLSWTTTNKTQAHAGLEVAFQIMAASSQTLEAVCLQNLEGRKYTGTGFAEITLPHLSSLQLLDGCTDGRSILGIILAHVQMPVLRQLHFATSDILAGGLIHTSKSLRSLRRVTLRESFMRYPCCRDVRTLATGYDEYDEFQRACATVGIDLQIQMSPSRCSDAGDFAIVVLRATAFAEALACLSITVTDKVLNDLLGLDKLYLPSLRKLAVTVTDAQTAAAEKGIAPKAATKLSYLLKLFDAPRVNVLGLILLAETAFAHLDDVLALIVNDQYMPCLEDIEGTVLLQSADRIAKTQISSRNVCDMLGIECADLKFIANGITTEEESEPCSPSSDL